MTDDDLDARRARLRTTLDKREAAQSAEAARAARGPASPYGQAFRLSSEFISAIAAGGILGWLLDWALGTTPWLMIVLLLLGFVAGVLNVLRSLDLIRQPRVGKNPPDGA